VSQYHLLYKYIPQVFLYNPMCNLMNLQYRKFRFLQLSHRCKFPNKFQAKVRILLCIHCRSLSNLLDRIQRKCSLDQCKCKFSTQSYKLKINLQVLLIQSRMFSLWNNQVQILFLASLLLVLTCKSHLKWFRCKSYLFQNCKLGSFKNDLYMSSWDWILNLSQWVSWFIEMGCLNLLSFQWLQWKITWLSFNL